MYVKTSGGSIPIFEIALKGYSRRYLWAVLSRSIPHLSLPVDTLITYMDT